MSQAFAASASSEHHVAQQSRRDKLRVQQHQFVDGGSNSNPNQSVTSMNMNMLTNSSAIYDFAVSGVHGHDSSSSCDWIVNQINSTNHPLLQSNLYRLLASTEIISTQDTLQAMVAPSSATSLGLEIASQLTPWQQHQMIKPLRVEGGFDHGAVASATQGLSFSLASKPLAELHVAGHSQFDHVGFPNCSNPPQAKLLMDPRLAVGPLGPFTGYATILKSSKFLQPVQQLLDEFCSASTGSKFAKKAQCGDHLVVHERRNSGEGSVGHYDGEVGGDGSSSVRGGNSGVSSSSFYSPTEGGNSSEGGAGSGANCSIQQQPEIEQKKVKLLYLHEEVCRRYKQYHQQMQMVVSSFESVAGLSAATPYTSLALKNISKQFKSIKHSISNQLRHVSRRVLGEDFMSSPSSSSRGETMSTPRLKYIDQNLGKQKASENTSLGFLDNNHPVWRPQRGLPERAVSVLRAWLFEHFLRPYPTDTDKHMLATQTGLTRNQVSNWFINARVRLWKPMVEEIHMLESNGMAEMDVNSSHKNDGKSIMDDSRGQPYCDQGSEPQSNKPLDYSSAMDHVTHESSSIISMEQWHGEKRLRMEECTLPGSMDGGLMSIAYQGTMDIGRLGAVSLTLGLRHNEDPQQQQQQQMRHFGSQMLRDFVG